MENPTPKDRENTFKALRSQPKCSKASYEEELFISSLAYESWELTDTSTPVKEAISTEKDEVMDSLKKFVEVKLEESESSVFQFRGGEVLGENKSEADYQLHENIKSFSSLGECSECLKQETILVGNSSKVKLIALGESLYNDDDEESAAFSLFQKMMTAMGLKPEEYSYGNVSNCKVGKNNCRLKLLKEISESSAQVLVCFGAVATNHILNKRRKLTQIHGKEHKLTLVNEKTINKVMYPIFHPDYLLINPGMKKVAWGDLQKIMDLFALN